MGIHSIERTGNRGESDSRTLRAVAFEHKCKGIEVRILLLSDAASVHTHRWVEALAARGHEIHVATLREGTAGKATVHRLPTRGLGKAGYMLVIPALRSLVRALQPDVVHAHYATSYGFIAAAAHVHPLVVTAWGSDVLFPGRGKWIARWFTRRAFRGADVATTVAEHMNSHVQAIIGGNALIPAIPFGADLQVFKFAPQRDQTIPLRIVCTRNFHPIYDVPTLVRGFAIIRRLMPATLVLTGDGPQRVLLETLVAELNLQQDVVFKGHIEPDRIAEELAHAHLFVTPALSDGSSVSLNEAMAVGCFPVCARIPANSQWLEDGENGMLFESGSPHDLARALAAAWSDPIRRERASVVNRQIVEKRANWEVSIDLMQTLYRDAIALNHARPKLKPER